MCYCRISELYEQFRRLGLRVPRCGEARHPGVGNRKRGKRDSNDVHQGGAEPYNHWPQMTLSGEEASSEEGFGGAQDGAECDDALEENDGDYDVGYDFLG